MHKIIVSNKINNIEEFGGKIKGLLQLTFYGLMVPKFYVIPYDLLIEIQNNKIELEDVLLTWKKENNIKESDLFSVRSSAAVEDGKTKSFAGLFSTILNCQTKDLNQAIHQVHSGFKKVSQLEYNDNVKFKFHIIIQEMIHAELSGVAFSKNPSDKNDNSVIINVIPGSGNALVSGDENAMTIKFAKGNNEFLFMEEEYKGKDPITDEVIIKKFDELKSEILPHIRELSSKVKKLEKKHKNPIDVEFCIKDGKLFWLQMRPITTLAESIYWDNTGIGENYPGISMPLTLSFVKQSYYLGYLGMFQFLNSNKKFVEDNKVWLSNMVGGINGVLYYNITSWQKLLYQMPFGEFTSKMITRLLVMPDAPFEKPARASSFINFIRFFIKTIYAFIKFKTHKKKFLLTINEIIDSEKDKDYSMFTHEELIINFHKVQHNITRYWIAPMLNGFYTLFFYGTLKRVIEKSKIKQTHPNFTNDILFAQGDVISVKIIQELRELIDKIYENETLLDAFRNLNIDELKSKIAHLDRLLFHKIIQYIDKYGDRSEEGELRMETINYRECPDKFWKMLQENVQLAPHKRQEKKSEVFDYKSIIKQHYPFNISKRIYLNFLVKNTIQRMKDRENFRFLRTQAFAIFRRIFRAIDGELLQKKLINTSGDSLYLEFDEILNATISHQFQQIIQTRKEAYNTFSTDEMPSRYIFQNNIFRPVYPALESNGNQNLKGIGCCSGIVKGRITVISSQNIHARNWENQIVISKNFEPGWISLFANAKGLISERGSLLSHTSILCRELYIPSIVGVNGLLKTLHDGDYIEMDGSTGLINKISNE